MKDKKEFALFAPNTTKLQKWKPTILRLGTRVVKLLQTTAKCFAKTTIEENRGNKKMYIAYTVGS